MTYTELFVCLPEQMLSAPEQFVSLPEQLVCATEQLQNCSGIVRIVRSTHTPYNHIWLANNFIVRCKTMEWFVFSHRGYNRNVCTRFIMYVEDLLKCAELNPIVKKSHSLQKGNYRPVSVLTIISKSYESVMNDQMTKHFIEIWEDHSCQALLFKCVDD